MDYPSLHDYGAYTLHRTCAQSFTNGVHHPLDVSHVRLGLLSHCQLARSFPLAESERGRQTFRRIGRTARYGLHDHFTSFVRNGVRLDSRDVRPDHLYPRRWQSVLGLVDVCVCEVGEER